EQYRLVARPMFCMENVIQPRLRDLVSHTEILRFFLDHKEIALYRVGLHVGLVRQIRGGYTPGVCDWKWKAVEMVVFSGTKLLTPCWFFIKRLTQRIRSHF